MRRAARLSVAFAACAFLGWGATAHAQEGRVTDARENPFLSAPTDEEDKRIAERERMRQVVREMMPEIKAMIQEQVGAARQQITEEVRKAAIEAVRSEPTLQTVSAAPAQAGAMATAIPGRAAVAQAVQAAAPAEFHGARVRAGAALEGAKYIACVNERALYRDKDGTRFYSDAPCK